MKKNLEAIQVILLKNRLVPVKEPFFTFKLAAGFNRSTGERLQVVVIRRAKDGSAATDAIRPGDLLDTLLKDRHASKSSHFFWLGVCADSIPAFYTLSKAITERGYDYSWDTFKDREVIVPAGNQGSKDNSIRVYPPEAH